MRVLSFPCGNRSEHLHMHHESKRCSRDTYPDSYITKYTCIRRETGLALQGLGIEEKWFRVVTLPCGNRSCGSGVGDWQLGFGVWGIPVGLGGWGLWNGLWGLRSKDKRSGVRVWYSGIRFCRLQIRAWGFFMRVWGCALPT